jgi:Flp pilus assembly protein TadG
MSAEAYGSGGERGAVAVELVALTPVLILAMWLVSVFALRLMLADAQVDAAARDAARAASIARSPQTARVAASTAAMAALAGANPQCRTVQTLADTVDFEPGGAVRVSVRCTLQLADLGLLGLRTTRTVSATYLAPIDEFRGVGP